MIIHGFFKTTLLDYPGHLAATVFLGNCNFRCPFCHNSSLVLSPDSNELLSSDKILDHLQKRLGILEGICITGGEPTLNPNLQDFIIQLRSLGFKIKLDTNGYKPDTIKSLLDQNLIDYIAMDIKSSRQNYYKACGVPDINTEIIDNCIKLITTQAPDYEFRTTLVKGIHTSEDIADIGNWLGNVKHYYLQNFKDSENVITKGYKSFTDEEMKRFKQILLTTVPNVKIRGEF